jgi:hypothetical protein
MAQTRDSSEGAVMDNRFCVLDCCPVFGEMKIGGTEQKPPRTAAVSEPEDITFSSPTTTTNSHCLARQAPALLVGGLKDDGRPRPRPQERDVQKEIR